MLVFLGRAAVDEIAGADDQRRPGIEPVELRDTALQRARGVDNTVRLFTDRLDVQVGNLRDQQRFAGHAAVSSMSSRTAEGSTRRPIRSPDFMAAVFTVSTTSGRSMASTTVIRWRSPTKRTTSTRPQMCDCSSGTMDMVSGLIIAVTLPLTTASEIGRC